MKELIKQAGEMVGMALQQANDKHPLFHSLHEGKAVLQEEIEEFTAEYNTMISWYEEYWEATKHDDFERAGEAAENMNRYTKQAIAELAQVGAMAAKILKSMEGMK